MAGAGYLGLGVALWHFQDSLILHPSATPAGPNALVLGGRYVGQVHEPAGAARGTVVFYHGNGGTVADRAFVAEAATALGYRVVLIEYQGYGARAGVARLAEYGARSVADFDLVRAHFPGQPIAVAGESFGAGMAAVVAGARAGQVCSVTLITPWNRLSELVQEKLPMFPARLLLKAEYASDLELKPYTGPVTIVAGELDTMILPHHARRLVTAHAGARFELLPAVGHNTWPQRVDGASWQRWLSTGCTAS